MSIKISLSSHADKFTTDSHEFNIEKKVNFIFGKNGTGKTTIADEMRNQLSDSHDVCVFKDFDGVAENERLDAVALGTENATKQGEIDIVDVEIAKIEKQLKQQDDKKSDNLFTQAAKAQKEYDDAERAIAKFFTTSAAQIKNQSKPQIAKTNYDKNDFQNDIKQANLLSGDDIATHKNNIEAEEKADISKISFNHLALPPRLKYVNEILQSSVVQPKGIPELEDNANKQKFAETGMEVHKHEKGETCAFCGNEISDERWQLLGNYFNDEYKKLGEKVDCEIAELKGILEQVLGVGELVESAFYSQFSQEAKTLNLQIKAKKSEIEKFFDNLISALEDKHDNLFSVSDILDIKIPKSFDDIQTACDDLINRHNQFSKNIKTEQERAKNALRYHEVRKKLDEFKYDEKSGELIALKTINDKAQESLRNKRNELESKQDERKGLILQTKDEEKIAEKINKLLTNMGAASFSLKLIEDDSENQKGQYQVKGHDEKIRPVTQLSKGEKNIIAFLYFIFSLESVDRNTKPRVIVLDDPMTSNDDTMQYLMIGEIQKLYNNLEEGNYIILLTHNCHFYLNVRPSTMPKYKECKEKGLYEEINLYKRYGIYHLLSNGKQATIKSIINGKQDFKTNYEALWKEIVFLYDAKDATSDLMLSPCRKICETYLKFTKQDVMVFYGENISAKKLFDVNQHSIDDLEAEQNGRTKEEIKDILRELFKANDAENHFNAYWEGGEQ